MTDEGGSIPYPSEGWYSASTAPYPWWGVTAEEATENIRHTLNEIRSTDFWGTRKPKPCPWHDRDVYPEGTTVEQLTDRPVVICGACGERLPVQEVGSRKVYGSLWDRLADQNAREVPVYRVKPIRRKPLLKVG